MYQNINECRICRNKNLVKVLDLGIQTLTGVFPSTKTQIITSGPIQLVKCTGNHDCCGLLQMAYSYDLKEMYGNNYGYRSGLNPSMVKHLHKKVERILDLVDFDDQPIVVDIGSNDGTTLAAYPANKCTRVGIDPTAEKFRKYYEEGIIIIPDFFSSNIFNKFLFDKKARVVTSFSMFYDLERPLDFVREVSNILDDNGIWVFEQSYMPQMLERNSYDTACHEHLEYYGLKQIHWMLSRCNLKIIDVEFNDINGGSFSVTAAKQSAKFPDCKKAKEIIDSECDQGLDELEPYQNFSLRVEKSRNELCTFVKKARSEGRRVAFLGASTKGNVILQYCGFNNIDIECVGEVNPEKFGAFTPGTLLPIIDEKVLLTDEPDYLIVLPWHFRSFFIDKYKLKKAQLVFPLPVLEIYQPIS